MTREEQLATPPRFLLAVSEPPAEGGSSTAAYQLFRRLQGDGYDVHLVSLLEEGDAAYFGWLLGEEPGNPERLPNAGWCRLRGRLNDDHPEVGEVVAAVDPDLMVGFGYLATLLLASAAPDRPTVFVTGNCRQAQDYVTSCRRADAVSLDRDLESGRLAPLVVNQIERRALRLCDLLVTHSELTRTMMLRFFPTSISKIYPNVITFAEWICDEARRWQDRARAYEDRDIDVLFIASDWTRVEKNYPLVGWLSRVLEPARIHLVGRVKRELPRVTHHGFVTEREKLFDLLGRARCVACPSLIDAAPGILFEASVMGCNLVASKNCGNWELCHPELLVDPSEPSCFADRICRALTRKYDDRLEQFLARRSYCELVALLTAMARPFRSESWG